MNASRERELKKKKAFVEKSSFTLLILKEKTEILPNSYNCICHNNTLYPLLI